MNSAVVVGGVVVAFKSVAQRLLLIVSLLAPLSAGSAQRPGGPPAEIREYFEAAKAACQAAGGRFVADPEGFYEAADFNGDNRPDYLVSPGGLYCSEFGYSEHCGSAGCTQIVLISEGDRLREVYQSNIQGFALTRLPNGRQGLAVGMHGSACGRTGADTCFGMMGWNGRVWTTTRVNRAPPELTAAMAAEAAATAAAPSWEGHAGSAATGPVALLRGHPQLPIILARCVEGQPILLLRLGANARGRDLPLPPAGRPLTLRLYDSAVGEQMIDLEAIAEPREFVGPISPQAYAMLAGEASLIEIQISSPEGDYWLPADGLSLVGSSAALRPVAAACSGGSRPAAPHPAASGTAGPPVAPLGIAAGHYVTEGVPCTAPEFEVFYYDGTRIGLLRQDERFIDPIGPVARSGRAFFLESWEMSVTPLSPTRIQREIQDTAAPERWCPASQIPAGQRYQGR